MTLRPHKEDWLLLLLAAAALLAALLFAKFGSEVVEGELRGIDEAARAFALGHRPPGVAAFFSVIAWFGTQTALVLLALIGVWFVPRRRKLVVLALLLTAFISSEFVSFVKSGYGVVRPEAGRITRESFSFPSGHVSGTTAIAVILCYIALRRRVARVPTIVSCVLVLLLMGASRIVLDMHWLSDVLGGYLIGGMIGLAFSAVYEWILRHKRITHRPSASAPGASGT